MKIVKRTLKRPIYILAAVHYQEVFLYIGLRWKKNSPRNDKPVNTTQEINVVVYHRYKMGFKQKKRNVHAMA